MADGAYLPPVVAALVVDDQEALAELGAFKAAMAEAAASMDADTTAMGASAGNAGRDLESLGQDAAASGVAVAGGVEHARDSVEGAEGDIHGSAEGIGKDLEGIGASAEAGRLATHDAMQDIGNDLAGVRGPVEDAADDVHGATEDMGEDLKGVGADTKDAAAGVHAAAGDMTEDLAGMGAGAVAGGAVTEDAVKGASGAVEDAEKDVESKSRGFSSRVATAFESVGNSMASFGLPFGNSVKKMGYSINEAEETGRGFEASMTNIGKVATAVGGAIAVGFGVESVKAAVHYEDALVSLDAAIKGAGGSVAAMQPQISATEEKMGKLGFTQQEVAESMTHLTVATKSPTKAMEEQGLAANIARMKNESLGAASESLAKTFAGSNRLLTKLGLNVLAGSDKLTTLQAATEGVEKAQTAYKEVQEEVSSGTLTGTEATLKLQAAHETLSAAELKQKQDQEGLKTVLGAVAHATAGQAAKANESLAGKMRDLHASIDAIEVAFGSLLIPVLKAAAGAMLDTVNWFIKGGVAAKAVAAVIAGPLVLAIGFYVKSLVEASAAQVKTFAEMIAKAAVWAAAQAASVGESIALWAMYAAETVADAAMTVGAWIASGVAALAGGAMVAAGILLATAGIALLVIGVVELVKHWHEVWATIKAVISDAVAWIKSHIVILLAVLALPLAVMYELVKHWGEIWGEIKSVVSTVVNEIKSVMSAAWNGIKSGASTAWNAISSAVSDGVGHVLHFIEDLPGKVLGILSTLVRGMEKLGSELVHSLISGIEGGAGDVAKAIEHLIPGGGLVGKAAEIVGLASGGIVTKPTLAVIGEAGPEAVVPLSGGVAADASGIRALGAASGGSSTPGGLHIDNVVVNGAESSPGQIVNELYQKIRPYLQQVV